MDKIEQLQQERSIRNWNKKRDAPMLSDFAPDIDHIEIIGTFHFITSVCSTKPYSINLIIRPDEKCFLHINCVNKDCTSDGFDLTSSLEDAIRHRRCVTVDKRCDGKEDWKYLQASGCSCATTLECTIIPHFKA